MINLDIDLENEGSAWEIQLIIMDCSLSIFGKLKILVSPNGGGVHFIIPGGQEPEIEETIREMYDCPGHHRFTIARNGQDILFHNRGMNSSREVENIFQAIDILKQNVNRKAYIALSS